MSRRRRKHRSNALTLSARDADWAVVREKAKRRRLSMSRYAEALVLGNGWEVRDGPALKVDESEPRELLDTRREFRALMGDKSEASSLIRDMQARVALLFDAWAISMVREGRPAALHAIQSTLSGALQWRSPLWPDESSIHRIHAIEPT